MTTSEQETIEHEVKTLLGRSAAWRGLPEDERQRIAQDTVAVVARMAAEERDASVDFPAFVASLVKGTFEAIVDGSIQQMEAYAAMVRWVAESVAAFAAEHVEGGEDRDHLTRPRAGQAGVATTMRAGIDRIVATDGSLERLRAETAKRAGADD
jgi:hypothetical protein